MKLTRVELKDYRCFAQTTLTVDPYATVLMGPNDAGKSWLLRALATFGARQDFAIDDTRKVSAAEGRSGQMQLTLEFSSFNEDEIAHLQRFGLKLKPDDRLSLTRIGLSNADKPRVLLNGANLRESLSGKPTPTLQPVAAQEDANETEVT